MPNKAVNLVFIRPPPFQFMFVVSFIILLYSAEQKKENSYLLLLQAIFVMIHLPPE